MNSSFLLLLLVHSYISAELLQMRKHISRRKLLFSHFVVFIHVHHTQIFFRAVTQWLFHMIYLRLNHSILYRHSSLNSTSNKFKNKCHLFSGEMKREHNFFHLEHFGEIIFLLLQPLIFTLQSRQWIDSRCKSLRRSH